MVDFSALISRIEAAVYENGVQAITGQILQDCLKDVVNTINVQKQDGIYHITVTVDGTSGTPSGTARMDDETYTLELSFSGLKGEVGPAGPQGEKGDKGDTGERGVQGPTGATGAQGPIGPVGPQGIQGERGPAGTNGEDGVGITDIQQTSTSEEAYGQNVVTITLSDGTSKSFVVRNGGAGPQGPQGPQGVQGNTGERGADGISITDVEQIASPSGSGAANIVRITRSNGVATDVTIRNGQQGETGPQGPAGPQGPQGVKGDTGDAGPAGATGPQGPKGDTGETGATGAQGPKGDTGETGATGPAGPAGANGTSAGFGTPTASVDANVGTPSVTVSASGPDTAKVFNFAFHNLKGATGATGAKGDTGATGATGATGPQGPKGDQGNPGSSVDYPFTLANNLTETDSTKALAAPQGKVLDEKISQLGLEVSQLPDEVKFYTDTDADLDISDKDFNVLVRFAKGHIDTARFSSAEIMKRTLFAPGFVTHGTSTVDGFPANTIEMFRAAAAAYHTKFIECDFVATSDGKMVGCHNASATMYLNGTAETVTFAEKTLSQLKEYTWDAAGTVRITEINELIDWIKVKGFCLWIDAKGTVTDAMVKAAYAYAKTIGWERYIFVDERWWTDEFCNPAIGAGSAAAVYAAAAKKTPLNNVMVTFAVHTGPTDEKVQEICAAAKAAGVFVAGWTAGSTHLEACRRYFTYGTDFIIANGLSNEQI